MRIVDLPGSSASSRTTRIETYLRRYRVRSLSPARALHPEQQGLKHRIKRSERIQISCSSASSRTTRIETHKTLQVKTPKSRARALHPEQQGLKPRKASVSLIAGPGARALHPEQQGLKLAPLASLLQRQGHALHCCPEPAIQVGSTHPSWRLTAHDDGSAKNSSCLVDVSVTRWYHCITRCVRRAFLLSEAPLDPSQEPFDRND